MRYFILALVTGLTLVFIGYAKSNATVSPQTFAEKQIKMACDAYVQHPNAITYRSCGAAQENSYGEYLCNNTECWAEVK